jgi:hypothetical protein
VPGLTAGSFGDELLDRRPGIYGAIEPVFKSHEVIRFIQSQTAYSDAVRTQLLNVMRAEAKRRRKSRRSASDKKDKKNKKSKDASSSSSSSSSSPRSSESEGERQKRREKLKYKYMAKEKPGVAFAQMTANCRQALGQYGIELDVGSQGPIYKRWWDGSFTKENPCTKGSRLERHWDELNLLVVALDEFYSGRMVEVGDILASRLRMLTMGIEKGTWRAARHLLVYEYKDVSLNPEELVDDVLKIEASEVRREKRLAGGRDSTRVG